MPESPIESAVGTWSVLECPFAIEYLPQVMDDMRLAVVDAFFSLPRGGAEIGGILLGRHTDKRVTIAEYVALDCEHAMGPSFVLSPRDEAKLQELLGQAGSDPAGLEAVGWYHSHTRSEIFLSEADQDVHKRFFPEPWQVALVFKPHTFQPMRCGFFFTEPDGSIHSNASYLEFALEAMPLRPVPTGVAPAMPVGGPRLLHREPDNAGAVINIPVEAPAEKTAKYAVPAATEPPAAPAPAPDPVALVAPKFATLAPEARSGRRLKAVLAWLAVGLALAGFAFQTRQVWMPKLLGQARPAAESAASGSLGLSTADTNGQLQIRWDRSSPVVQQSTGAVLTIADGGLVAKEIHLDPEHLRSGTFTYGRESEQVDVTLTVSPPYGKPVRELAGFAGKALPKTAPAAADDSQSRNTADAQIAKLKDDLATQVAQVQKVNKLLADQSLLVSTATRMKSDLAAQMERGKRLEKSLSDAQARAAEATKLRKDLAAANDQIKKLTKSLADAENALKQQQRKRLGAQDPGAGK